MLGNGEGGGVPAQAPVATRHRPLAGAQPAGGTSPYFLRLERSMRAALDSGFLTPPAGFEPATYGLEVPSGAYRFLLVGHCFGSRTPIAVAAGVSASLLFDEGRNAVQVQRWLGHHSPAFTLATYVHLLSDDLGAPLPDRSTPA